MRIKKIMAFGLLFVLLCTMSATAFAKEGVNSEKQPKVVIGDTAEPVPDYVIQDIIKANPDAGQINITEYGTSDINKNKTVNQRMALQTELYFSNVVKTQTQSGVLVSTNFVTSMAKGQSMSIGYEWSSTLSCTINGNIDAYSLGITESMTRSYSASTSFSGPPESSPYNTRFYYVNFYENRGTYTATCYDPFPGWYINYPVSGSYTEPAYYASYNVDATVS